MLIVNPNLRITRYYDKKVYGIYIPTVSIKVIEVNKTIYNIIREVNSGRYNTYENLLKIVDSYVIDDLLKKQIIVESDEYIYNENVLEELETKYPLQSVVIELTNACNLNCIHCYGRFGEPSSKKMYNYDDIVKLKKELDRLHTMEIRLSGGECFLNPEFEKIALFFLMNGFRVCIYTNGFLTDRIVDFLEKSRNYYYVMAISLDGLEDYHNIVRGNELAYKNVISLLTILKKYNNVDVLIESAVMKQNLCGLDKLKEKVQNEFPDFEHKIFCVTPDYDENYSFNLEDLMEIKNKYSYLFDDLFAKSKYCIWHKKRFRCWAGITNGVITVEGDVKICPIANESIFKMGNITEKSLYDIWCNPNESIKLFRNEYSRDSPQCKKCNSKKICGDRNCRIEAYRLTGNVFYASPYTCIPIKGEF